MAKITISNISIENLGPFRERQTLDLGVSTSRPVILVKALNGSGKTTLLTALQIGLYGQQAFANLRRSEYEQLLLDLQRKDAVGNAVIKIGVVVEVGGSRRRLVVRREWFRRPDGLHENLGIFEGGSQDLDFSETWDEFIGSILPPELVQLFLFDGEKIEALANPDRLPDLLKRATEVFLGIGGIESLGNDLRALERRAALKNKSTSAEFATTRANLRSWEAQAKELEVKLAVLTQEQASAHNAADQARATLEKFSVKAQSQGLAAYEKAASIRNNMLSCEGRVETARAKLAEAISDPVLPVTWLLSGLWEQYRNAWELDQHARHAKLLGQEFKKRDQRVISVLTATAPKATVEAVRKALADDLRTYNTSRSAPRVVLQDAPPKEVERVLYDARIRLKNELGCLREARADLDRAEQHIGQIPAEEQISEILQRLQEYSMAASAAEMHFSDVTQQIEEVRSQLNHIQVRMNAALGRLGTDFRDHELEAKSLEASARAKKALIVFKERLLASKAQWLSEMITAEFRGLLRKRNLIAKVVIDPSTYRVSIKNGKHEELPMDRLSAGERQLLAISVLSALIKERKGRFPVVVDTPLARLDQQHRSALIKRFFATVSHQVVVLSTDQEVDGLAYDALKSYTSAEYSFDFDDVAGRTVIHNVQAEGVV